jgi:Tol biopolymer transport system component
VIVAAPELLLLGTSQTGEDTKRVLAGGPVLHPAASLDGAWIAFAAAYDGDLDLYRVSAGGTGLEQLINHQARDSHPAWLPAAGGERLIFVSDRSGLPALYLLDLASSESVPLDLPTPASWPAISPDGRQLAFATAPAGDWNLYRVALAGDGQVQPGTLVQLTETRGSDIAPAWRPDGKALAFASSRSGSLALYLLTLDDGRATALGASRAAAWAPAWLAEGRLLYHAYDGRRLQAFLLETASGASIPLTPDLEHAGWPSPAWARD